MTYKVAVVVGSLRRESFNRQLAQAVISLAPADFTFEFLEIGNLPLYSQDYDADFPEVARNLKQKISEANALLFVTPEYNRSIPGVLKNAIDWGSRPWGHSAWGGKPGAVIGTSVGAIGTAIAQSHLRGVCAYLDIPTARPARDVHQARCNAHRCKRQDRERGHAQVPAGFRGQVRRVGEGSRERLSVRPLRPH